MSRSIFVPCAAGQRRIVRRFATAAAAAAFIVPVLTTAGDARAQVSRAWTRPAGGSFADASNWSPFGSPATNDGAEFALPSFYTVVFPGNRTTAGAYVAAGNVTWDLGDSGVLRTYTVGGLDVAGSSSATPLLTLRDGNVSAAAVRVQNGAGLNIGPSATTGAVPVTVTVADELRVASGGLLTLDNFHNNHVLNANGNVLIDGGTLRRTGGGGISTGGLRLAAGRTLTVQNAGSFAHGGTLGVQNGTLHVRAAGRAHAGGLDLATTGAGTVLVEGAGSSLTMDLTLHQPGFQTWGATGHAASVDVRGGASATLTGGLRLASDGGAARLTVDGPGTTFTQRMIGLGEAQEQFIVGHASAGSAELTVRNGAAFTSDAGIVGEGRIIINTTGRINVESGGTFAAARIDRTGGQFNMLGGTVRFDQFTGNLLNQSGTLRPGYGPASIAGSIHGNYTQQPAGSLGIDIGGVLPGEMDRLIVTGNAVIAGTLDLALVDDFIPIIGNTFPLVQTQSGNVGGRFSRVNGTLPLPDIGLAVTYTPTQVLARASLVGDVNFDNSVNLADFNVLAGNFGASNRTWAQADFTGDGVVNLQDFDRLAGHFGLSAGPDGVVDAEDWANLAAAVPEPAGGLVYVSLAAAAAGFRRRRFLRA